MAAADLPQDRIDPREVGEPSLDHEELRVHPVGDGEKRVDPPGAHGQCGAGCQRKAEPCPKRRAPAVALLDQAHSGKKRLTHLFSICGDFS